MTHDLRDSKVKRPARPHDQETSLSNDPGLVGKKIIKSYTYNAAVEVAQVSHQVTPPTAAPQQKDKDPTYMSIELPELPDRAPGWTYMIKEHSYERMISSSPWHTMSRESALEKDLQLLPALELVTHVAKYLVNLQLKGTNFAQPPDKMSGSDVKGWQIATMVNRLITYNPNWRSAIVEEYLLLQRRFTLNEHEDIKFQKAHPITLEEPKRETPSRLQLIDRHISSAERKGTVTYFSRIVLTAWRQVTMRKIRARSLTTLRDVPNRQVRRTTNTSKPLGQLSSLPVLGMTLAAEEEFNQIVAIVGEAQIPEDPDVTRANEKLFDRIRAEARRLAREKGSSLVNFRDVRQSAESIDKGFRKKVTTSPSEEQPEHIDEVVESLATLKAETLRLSRGGIAPPRVLVVGETGSAESPPIVAKMFREAGADVATCDFKASSFEDIPHYEGDSVNIQDQGWDLVILHPPCTYLSNAGVTWLKDDPIRWKQMRQNASVFRMLYEAQAPFVAAENAKMHKHARLLIGDIRPTQYVHPWQHGHGHTKPTGLYLKNLPPLVPSNEVQGRDNVLATLMPSPTRAEKRSRTYAGIAAAMAIQWMPTLNRHSQSPAVPRNGLTAEQMVTKAKVDPIHRVQLAFVRRAGGYESLTQGSSLPTKITPNGSSPITTVMELASESQVNQSWIEALQAAIELYPDGSRCFYETPDAQTRFINRRPTITRVWVVDVSDATENNNGGAIALRPGQTQQWTPIELLRPPKEAEWSPTLVRRYIQAIDATTRAPLELPRPQLGATVSKADEVLESTNRQSEFTQCKDLYPTPPHDLMTTNDLKTSALCAAVCLRRPLPRPQVRAFESDGVQCAQCIEAFNATDVKPWRTARLCSQTVEAAATVSQADQILESSNRRPWLVDYQDLPPPPPTPRHIRRLHGKWRVWNTLRLDAKERNEEETALSKADTNLTPKYGWQTLPPTITDVLNAHLGLPFTPMKATQEGEEVTQNTLEETQTEAPPTKAKGKEAPGNGSSPCPTIGVTHKTETAGIVTAHRRPSLRDDREDPDRSHDNTNYATEGQGVCAVVPVPKWWSWSQQPVGSVGALRGINWNKNPAEWMIAQGGKICPPLTEKSKNLWTLRPSRLFDNLGIGASQKNPPYPRKPYPKQNLAARLAFVRSEYQQFVPEAMTTNSIRPPRLPPQQRVQREKEEDVAMASPMDNTETLEEDTSEEANSRYSQWLTECSDRPGETPVIAAMVRSSSSDSIMEQDVALTPSLEAYAATSLYVTNFQVARRAQTRHRADTLYTVDTAVAGKVLADTGAAPSIVTTELLEKLPKDCRLSRDPYANVGPLNGADGRPLVTLGKVRIDFLLGKTRCRHEFTVVQGKPLILLGNDFLVPRNAEIHLNTDGKGNGLIKLTSDLSGGRRKEHSFQVTSNAQRPDHRCPIRQDGGQKVAIVDNDPQTTPGPTKASGESGSRITIERWLPEPKKPEALTAEAFKDDCWTLETSEHLLYTTEAVEIPPMSRVTIRVRAPQQLIQQGSVPSCLVERLRQVGPDGNPETDSVPQVIPRLTTIQDGHLEVQLINTTRRKKSVAGFSPLAMLDSEYYVRGNVETFDPTQTTLPQEEPDPIKSLSELQSKLLDQVKIDPAGRLSEEQKTRVRRLVAKNISAFATDPKNPTKTHLMEVELPLKPNVAPHRHAASRVGEEGRQIIEKHIEEMESRGIIRKSNSAWGSRVVLVTKKDGSIRFCVDYRDLNSKLQLQDSPIPLTVEALDRLSSGEGCPSSLFLSTLDLASGFWTLPVREADKGLTAFVTHRQKYEFNYLPFGIQSGPSYMVRLMDSALQGLAWETCMPYLDDIGVWSTGMGKDLAEREEASFEQMMTRLQGVFERIRWAGLSMKANKCILFGIEAEYLGHIVSREGLKMDPKKIEVVRDWDTKDMRTVTKVRSFLGMCSYYRRFIEGFSRIAAPLTDLTKDGVDVERESQTHECQRAMQRLIKAITSEPVMSTPRFDRPFIVKTDAANKEGLGGVLGQLDNEGREKVVAYHGRRLNKHERNYTVTEIELLAAVDSIKHWRPYLWGRAFKLVVDHSALRWLHTMRDTMEGGPASRLMRWILKLSEYRFHVEHKPGALHKDADAISRLVTKEKAQAPLNDLMTTVAVAAQGDKSKPSRITTARTRHAAIRENRTAVEVQISYLDTGAPSASQLKREQEDDPECIEIMDYLSGDLDTVADDKDLKRLAKIVRVTTSGTHNQRKAVDVPQNHREKEMKIIRRMTIREGILYRSTQLADENSQTASNSSPDAVHWVPFVPKKLRSTLITAFHDRMGHASRDRVRGALQKRYYWPKMSQDVEDHVAECHECTLAKYPTTRSRDSVGPAIGRYPFDILYTDILDLKKTHDYTPEGAGHRKLVVFVDSLSRWVEAIPVHKDPTSAEFMDLFNEHIVARYGVPRAIVSDRGSNLVGRLNAEILERTGTDLRGTTAEHKEANGVVERFNQTLQNMVRASDGGDGDHWREHLPFVLMAYRATPHRITRESPAMTLFGRELKTPAQIASPDPPPSTLLHQGSTQEIREYATKLHNRMVYAWKAAYEASREAQGLTVSNTTAHALRGQKTYAVNDRVVRRLYDSANALANKYAGPYRITHVLANGRYRVRDLENRRTYYEFDVSNLRPYRTHTDDEALKADEYVVESLLSRRTYKGEISYLVKYVGYAKNLAQWTARTELERRCGDMLDEYDAKHPTSKSKAAKKLHAGTPLDVMQPQPTVVEQDSPPEIVADENVSHLPDQARLSMGVWSYGRKVKTRGSKGTKVVWKDASHYTEGELDSERFRHIREYASEAAREDQEVAAVFNQTVEYLEQPRRPDATETCQKVATASYQSDGSHQYSSSTGPLFDIGPNPVRELPSREEMVDYLGQPMHSDDAGNSQRVATARSHSDEPYSFGILTGLLHELGPTPVREEAADEYASQVWFVTNDEVMCRRRTGGIPERPQLDTYGGEMDPSDGGSYAVCALRKISEEAVLPESWWTEVKRAVNLDPHGKALVKIELRDQGTKVKTAVWFVRLTDAEAKDTPTHAKGEASEVSSDVMQWRSHGEVMSNLSTFDKTQQPLIGAMKKWLMPLSAR